MRIEKVVLRLVEMPLKFRFRTSFGETAAKRFLLVEAVSEGFSGWGECVAEDRPFYSPETTDSARSALSRFLIPLVLGRDLPDAPAFDRLAERVRGNRMAKGALEAALRDLFARADGVSLARNLGGTRTAIEVGVSLGLQPTVEATVENVRRHVAQGYRRIKVKIEPGSDVDRVAAVREAFPDLPLTVDANAAYTLETSGPLVALDAFGLDYIEQPLHHEDLVDHARLAGRLSTPICLDESIRSAADAAAAISLGACRVLNVKLGRVGGYGEVLRIHDVAAASGVPLWCGGMLESGVGRAHNIAVATLPGFTKPGDTASSSRYFDEDIVEPRSEAADGLMPVPEGPGIGVEVRRDVLARFTLETLELARVTHAPGALELLGHFSARTGAMLGDLEALVSRESPSSDAGAVTALAGWVRARLAASGVPSERVAFEGRGDGVLARLGPERGGTLLLGHLDTVWPAGTLARQPFHAGGNLATGPGVFDMKGGVAVLLAVLSAAGEGAFAPARGVSLLLTSDEEVGSGASRERILEEARRRERVFVLEPSGDGGAAKVARKGVGLAVARFQGVPAHSGLEPEKGASALLEMARFALRADALAHRDAGTTVVPTLASAGSARNVVPPAAEVTVDFRFWRAAEGERICEGLKAYAPFDARVGAEISAVVSRPPMEPTPESLALHRTARAIAAVLGFGLAAARVGGASDGNLTAAAGIPTLDGLGPRGGGAHARGEHVELDDLPRRAALVAALLSEVEI